MATKAKVKATSDTVPRLLRPREVAEVTGLERFRVYELVRTGRLPALRIGKTIRIAEDVLAEWIRRESAGGGAR